MGEGGGHDSLGDYLYIYIKNKSKIDVWFINPDFRFIQCLYKQYVDLYFTYLEINPLVITDGKVHFNLN